MTDHSFSSSRRTLLGGSAAAVTSLLATTGFAPLAQAASVSKSLSAKGPVTFYAEIRVAQPHKAEFDQGFEKFAKAMQANGALSISLKQMVGDSTMVKNYPESYKGLLREAYAEGAKAGTLPLFYSVFVRFSNVKTLSVARVDITFNRDVLPHLHGVVMKDGHPVQSPQPMAVYSGVFETVLAGDRDGIYSSPTDLIRFLTQPVDNNRPELVTVENHVFVHESSVIGFDHAVPSLLKVAQETERPIDATNPSGLPGAADNLNYRKAVSTEILRKVDSDGGLRAYIMHGVWESVWDHENSHLDARFKTAAAPVGAMVVIGPVEPFYSTQLTVLKS